MASSKLSNRICAAVKRPPFLADIVGLGDLGVLVLDGVVRCCGVDRADEGVFWVLALGFLFERGDTKDPVLGFLFEGGEENEELNWLLDSHSHSSSENECPLAARG